MSKGLPRSMSRGNPQVQEIIKQTVVADGLAIEIDGATGVGFGSAVIGGLPEGNILFLGAIAYMQVSGPGGDAGLVDTWEGDYGVGTTPASDGTITAADVDLIESTALAAATAEVSPRTRANHLLADTGQILDNTDGSLEINVNVLIDDASISADDIACTLDGEVYLSYIMLGDD